MAKASKKPVKRGLEQQLADLSKLQRRIANGGLLVKSDEKLLIDDFVKDYGKGSKRRLRDAVERLGHSAVNGLVWSYELPAGAREMSKRALQHLKKVDQDGRWLRNLDRSEMINLHMGFDAQEGHSGMEWYDIIDALKTIHRCYETLQTRYKIARPPLSGHSELLAGEFVRSFSQFHKDQIGRPAPKARTSRFVNLMEAAWIDLDFPDLPDGTLGNIAERLPHLGDEKS